MCVEDVGVAAVIINSQIIAVILENITCFGITHAADKFGNMATFKACTAPRCSGFAPLLIVPGCTVLQEYIDCTVEGLIASFVAFILEAVMCNASPYGICGCQAQVYLGVKLRLVGIDCTGRCAYVTLQHQLVISCAYCIVIFIQVNVHAGSAGFCHHCIVIMLVILIDFDVTAAVNRQLSMTAVSKQAVTVNLGIYITVDSNLRAHLQRVIAAAVYQGASVIAKSALFGGQTPFAVFVAHSGYITVKGYLGITICIQT